MQTPSAFLIHRMFIVGNCLLEDLSHSATGVFFLLWQIKLTDLYGDSGHPKVKLSKFAILPQQSSGPNPKAPWQQRPHHRFPGAPSLTMNPFCMSWS